MGVRFQLNLWLRLCAKHVLVPRFDASLRGGGELHAMHTPNEASLHIANGLKQIGLKLR